MDAEDRILLAWIKATLAWNATFGVDGNPSQDNLVKLYKALLKVVQISLPKGLYMGCQSRASYLLTRVGQCIRGGLRLMPGVSIQSQYV